MVELYSGLPPRVKSTFIWMARSFCVRAHDLVVAFVPMKMPKSRLRPCQTCPAASCATKLVQ